MERQIPKVGEFYRHFKNHIYQIVAVATHTETKESMVVYQALYGTFSVYVRPLNMFLSEVDREKYPLEKYPQYTQKFRFEKIVLEDNEKKEDKNLQKKKEVRPIEKKEEKEEKEETFVARNIAESYMIEFLDATTYKKRIEILDMMKPSCTEHILQNLAVTLDINISERELELQFAEFRKALCVRMKYETGRLRE